MLEKLQLAEEKIEIDNIQSKHKKHQAFEAELGIIKHAFRNSSYHSFISTNLLRRSFLGMFFPHFIKQILARIDFFIC